MELCQNVGAEVKPLRGCSVGHRVWGTAGAGEVGEVEERVTLGVLAVLVEWCVFAAGAVGTSRGLGYRGVKANALV